MRQPILLASLRALVYSICIGGFLLIPAAAWSVSADWNFQDPLDYPARMRSLIATRPLLSIARAGDRLVAVGSRGLIVHSENQGKEWTQSAVPVQSDLLAVRFITPQYGWAVGHDGVILHSGDGGKTWIKQLDGRIAAETFRKFYAVGAVDPTMQEAAAKVAENFRAGPSLPYLDVWFETETKGFAVGSFGMIAATVDGGETWEPWLHRIENDQLLNLNSIREIGGNIYIAGERGMIFKLDRKAQRFKRIETGYPGSFFGITGNLETLLAFGLRGVVYRSGDAGKTWEALRIPVEATITGGCKRLDGSGFILINSAGQFLVSDATGRLFQVVQAKKPMRYTAIVPVKDDTFVVTGLGGVRIEQLWTATIEQLSR